MFKYLSCFLFMIYSTNSFTQTVVCYDDLFCETTLLRHVKSLSSDAFEGRRTGTAGAIKTKKYIINQFHSLKVLPLGKTYEQNFQFKKAGKYYEAANVLGIIKGKTKSKKYIVISAHYDHVGIKKGKIYNGADDNASGLSALFSFAEYFINNPPEYSVILAAFDAEELGLQGSKYYLRNTIIPLQNIKMNLNMDMISRNDKNELYVVGTNRSKFLENVVLNLKKSKKIKLLTGHDGYDGKDNWTYASDHTNFYRKGIPFLYFGVEDHEDYHEPTDDYENIHPEFYVEAVKTIIKIFKVIDRY